MLGWIASLGIVILLLHLPVSVSPPRVGWSASPPAERIPVSEVSEEEPDPPSSAEAEDAPPPTRQSQPSPESPADASSTEDGEGEETATASDSSGSSSEVRTVASLTVADRRPEIIGGQGILNLHIHYPAAARRQGIEGRLKLQFTVGTNGWARDIRVSKSLHPLCDSAAIKALESVRFRPGTYRGEPVPIRMSLPIRFQLQPAGSRSPDPGTLSEPDG